MVFTTMGRSVAKALRSGTRPLPLEPEQAMQILQGYEETGFGFNYGVHPPEERLGEAVASPGWVCTQLERATPRLRLLLYAEESWLGQDVIACTSRS